MANVLQMKIVLNDIKPPIWRRFCIHDSETFDDLHATIQIMMDWEDYHLYSFDIDEFTRIEVEDREMFNAAEDFFGGMRNNCKRSKIFFTEETIGKFITQEKQKFIYTYDFGDNWEHTITVEKILPLAAQQKKVVCLKGARNAPPEDCGGIWGYENFAAAAKDKNHPDHKDLILDWYGTDFDPEYFNVEEVNGRLMKRFGYRG